MKTFITLGLFLLLPVSAQSEMLKSARKYLNIHERSIHFLGVNPRTTPWCGAFMTYVAKLAKRQPPPASNLAASWRHFGKPVRLKDARPGDVVVVRTKRGYHTGLLHHYRPGDKTVQLLGGNQSNRVKVSRFSTASVVSVRR